MNIFEKITANIIKKGMGITGVTDDFFALSVNNYFNCNDSGVLIVTPTLYEANKLYNLFLLYNKKVLFFPMDDFLTSQAVSVSDEYLSIRLSALNQLLYDSKQIVITSLEGYLKFLPSPKELEKSILNFKVGDIIDKQNLVEKLSDMGYRREMLTLNTGDFAVRGFVVDVFLNLEDNPVRIEFFDNEIESIRFFNADSQKSIKKLDSIKISPFVEKDNSNVSLKNYFKNLLVIYKDFNQIKNCYNRLLEDVFEYDNTKIINNYMFSLDDVYDKDACYYLSLDNKLVNDEISISNCDVVEVKKFNENFEEINDYLLKSINNKKTIILCFSKEYIKKLDNFFDILYILTDENHIYENQINVIEKEISSGFIYENYMFFSEKDFLNIKENNKVRSIIKKTSADKISNIKLLEIGDYVVHDHYGIGIYNGIKTLTKKGLQKDYIEVLYAHNDKLYIPVEKISLISKYASKDGAVAKVSSLSSSEWSKTKERVRKNLEIISREIILIQAKRKMAKGFAFSSDTQLQKDFEQEFNYVLTPGQFKSLNEIKRDMESTIPMDRMLCGDVGYGKTEVALRAIFKAINDSKQVLYLCPTTLLSNQVYKLALERFKNFPVKIGLLNRFVSKNEQTKVIKQLKDKTIDFVIGTHRALSDDVSICDLGLLIIDEEQKFGVMHKEKLKNLYPNIDILTLTATPIPRTLQMSLVGLKDLSVIDTPPENRLPVQTYVIEENQNLIRNAIYKELSRGGQVFVLSNKVINMNEQFDKLKKIVSDTRIAYAHGKMDSRTLEDTIYNFINKKYDVLLCTTIIENGIDMPNVNTLIVLDSDKLGLSQLYQLRGRVGRGDKLAYSYFMYNKDKSLNETAVKRLKVIKDYTRLGSGFDISNKDLKIRGAGDILGKNQAGFIEEIGVDLYYKILNNEVMRLKGLVSAESQQEEKLVPLYDVATHIDDSYVKEDDLKIEIHNKINNINSFESLKSIKSELEDRFGKINDDILTYMYEEWFEKLAEEKQVINVDQKSTYVEITFSKEKSNEIDYQELFCKSLKISRYFNFKYKNNLFYVKLFTEYLDQNPIYYFIDLLKEM